MCHHSERPLARRKWVELDFLVGESRRRLYPGARWVRLHVWMSLITRSFNAFVCLCVRGDCIKAHFGGILESDWRAVNKNKIAYLKVQNKSLLFLCVCLHSIDVSRLRWFPLVCPITPRSCLVPFAQPLVDPAQLQ